MVGSGFLKKPVIPAVCAGLVASVAFYVFYGLHIPRVFALIVFAFCVAAAFFAKDKRLQRLLVWSAVGLVLAFAALARLEAFVKTEALLPFQQIASITAELTGEPKPSLKYFSVDCVLKEVQDSRGSRFSASGNAKIFLPKAVVEQNLSGGISLVKAKRIFSQSGEDSAEGAVCTVFASGATVNLRAKYSQSEGGVACFFAENELPAFLGWHSPIARFRGTLRFQVMRLLFSWGAAGALLLALISADKNFLAPAVSTAFTDCGLAHVLALSGMHVSIVSGASEKLFKPFAGKKATGFISLACNRRVCLVCGGCTVVKQGSWNGCDSYHGETFGRSGECAECIVRYVFAPLDSEATGSYNARVYAFVWSTCGDFAFRRSSFANR